MTKPKPLTPAALARIVGRSEVAIRRDLRAGRIPAEQILGRWLIADTPEVRAAARKTRRGRPVGTKETKPRRKPNADT